MCLVCMYVNNTYGVYGVFTCAVSVVCMCVCVWYNIVLPEV